MAARDPCPGRAQSGCLHDRRGFGVGASLVRLEVTVPVGQRDESRTRRHSAGYERQRMLCALIAWTEAGRVDPRYRFRAEHRVGYRLLPSMICARIGEIARRGPGLLSLPRRVDAPRRLL